MPKAPSITPNDIVLNAATPTVRQDVLPRRRFLVKMGMTVAGATIGLVATGCGSDGEDQTEASGPVPGGNVSAVAIGSLKAVASGQPVALGRDAGGLYALTTICTHEKCNIAQTGTIDATGLACSCHGSRYNANGDVTSGPAPSPLKHFQVDLAADGTITVQASNIVAETVRTAVPA